MSRLDLTASFEDGLERFAEHTGSPDALVPLLCEKSYEDAGGAELDPEIVLLNSLVTCQEILQLPIVHDYPKLLVALVHFLGAKRSSRLQRKSLKLLITLCDRYYSSKLVIASQPGLLAALVRLLKQNWITTERIRVQVEAARCLLKLVSDMEMDGENNLQKIGSNNDVLDALASCMHTKYRIRQVRRLAIESLLALATCPKNRRTIVLHAGLLPALLYVMVHREQEQAVWCIAKLTEAPDIKIELASNSLVLNALVRVLGRANSVSLEPAITCLANLAEGSSTANMVRIASHSGLIDATVRLLEINLHSFSTVVELATKCLALLAMAPDNVKQIQCVLSQISLVLLLCSTRFLHEVVQEQIGLCLAQLSQVPLNQLRVRSCPGAVDALEGLLTRNTNSNTKEHAALCLFSLKSADEPDSNFSAGSTLWHDDPLTLELMCDPVKGNDGYTYDRWTIIDKHKYLSMSRSPYNPAITKFGIACDDLNVRGQLFQTFPEQIDKFRSRRREYREKALSQDKSNTMESEVAIQMLKNVLQWAPTDTECREELDRVQNVFEEQSAQPEDNRLGVFWDVDIDIPVIEQSAHHNMIVQPEDRLGIIWDVDIDIPVIEHAALVECRKFQMAERYRILILFFVYYGLMIFVIPS